MRRRHAVRAVRRLRPTVADLESRALLSLSGLTIDSSEYRPDRILVRYRTDAVTSGRALGSAMSSTDELVSGLREVMLPAGRTVADAVAMFSANPDVLYAEPDFKVHATDVVPNDPRFVDGSQWALNNAGQSGGTSGDDIGAEAAWGITTGTGLVTVAVLDTGIDYTHPDLAGNIWTNVGEIPGNGKDDDGDGFIDDVYGYDFANNDGDPIDDDGHGTHVAGTIGAVGNNGIGIAGIAWNVKLMAVKFLDSRGVGDVSGAIKGLNFAVAHGATISNNSYGADGYSKAFADAIKAAGKAGHIFVAAAGNGGEDHVGDDLDKNPSYPAGYATDIDNVISVAATDRNDRLTAWSDFGAKSVTLAAPGASIVSTYKGGGYATLSGTSMAAPHVVGVFALVRDLHPEWSNKQAIDAVLKSVEPLAGLSGKVATGGRVDAAKALDYGPPIDGPRVLMATPSGSVDGPIDHIRLAFSEPIDPASFTTVDVATLKGPDGSITPTAVTAVSGTNNTQFDVKFAPQSGAGTYVITVGPHIKNATGHEMDQDRDGEDGTSSDTFSASFTINTTVVTPPGNGRPVATVPGTGTPTGPMNGSGSGGSSSGGGTTSGGGSYAVQPNPGVNTGIGDPYPTGLIKSPRKGAKRKKAPVRRPARPKHQVPQPTPSKPSWL